MKAPIQRLIVRLPYMREDIFVGEGFIRSFPELMNLEKYDRALIIIDASLHPKHKQIISEISRKNKRFKVCFIKCPNNNKLLPEVEEIITEVVKCRLSRKSCLISVGGGRLADIVGFVASIYMRGIDFVQISTTLMSMGDAIIGKVAINYSKHKNLLGSFYSPRFVFCDVEFLETATKRQLANGLAEIWKHALITRNTKWLMEISKVLLSPKCSYMKLIYFSLRVKASYVQKDFDDTRNKHKALSLGHTFSNYFESAFSISHGEGVFYGILSATLLSVKLGLINSLESRAIMTQASLFEQRFGLLPWLSKRISSTDMVKKIKFDKINDHDSFTFVLPTSKGYIIQPGVSEQLLKEAILELKKLRF